MTAKYKGKVALVTGAGSGLGQACAEAFAAQGARVAVADIDRESVDEVVRGIVNSGGDALGLTCDVKDPSDVEAMVSQIQQAWGGMDIAVNNAGITTPVADLVNTEESDFDRVMAVNVKGIWLCMREELRAMLPKGAGVIVNMASALSLHGFSGASIYVASKHAVAGLTKTAAVEYAQSGVRINAVCPGIIQTPLIEKTITDPHIIAGMSSNHPMARLGTPEEVASAVLWIASEEASFVTGSLLSVDGGWSAL